MDSVSGYWFIGLHFGSKKVRISDKSSKIMDILSVFFQIRHMIYSMIWSLSNALMFSGRGSFGVVRLYKRNGKVSASLRDCLSFLFIFPWFDIPFNIFSCDACCMIRSIVKSWGLAKALNFPYNTDSSLPSRSSQKRGSEGQKCSVSWNV